MEGYLQDQHLYNFSRFHEGFSTLKSFLKVLMGCKKIWAKVFFVFDVLMTGLIHVWASCHSETFHLLDILSTKWHMI